MWRLRLMLEALPLLQIRMVLWLSWYIMDLLTWYPWSLRKFRYQITWGRASLTPTSSASMELLVLIFCLPYAQYMQPLSIVIIIPVWLIMLWCTTNATSMYPLIELRLQPYRIKGRLRVLRRYLQVRASFFQSWMFRDCTRVVRYDNGCNRLEKFLFAGHSSRITLW